MRFRHGIIGITLACSTAAVFAQNYHIVDHWKVGGQGGWDYMLAEDAAHRLYIAHNSRIDVLDTSNGKLIGAVSGFKSTHGVALDPNGRVGYISDGAGNAIGVFDRTTLAIMKMVPAGTNPDGIVYEPVTKTVWAFNGRSKDVSVMDTVSNSIIATISLPGKPEFPQVDGHGAVFVNIEDKNAIVKLDASSKKAVATWELTGCESPSGMAIDLAKHRLFSVCDGGKMAVTDYQSGKLLGLASIGESPDAAAYDAKRSLAFSSNGGSGNLTIVEASKAGYPTLKNLPTAKGARTMAYSSSTGRIYLCAAKYGPPPTPTASMPHPRPTILPDTLEVLVVEP
jgi:hypothetical protein